MMLVHETSTFDPRQVRSSGDLTALRDEFSAWLRACGVAGEPVDDLLIVVSELGANAVRESASDDEPPTITATLRQDRIVLTVENAVSEETAAAAHDWDFADPLRTGGRGLMLVRALARDLGVQAVGNRIRIRCAVPV